MKPHVINANEPTSIKGFVATFKSSCNSSKIHESAVMWFLPQYIQERLANAQKSCMCAENQPALLAAFVRNEPHRSRKVLRLYPEVVNYFLKKYAADQSIAEYDATILWYTPPANMTTTQQYASDQITKSGKDADVYNESTPNEVFTKDVDQPIRHSLQN